MTWNENSCRDQDNEIVFFKFIHFPHWINKIHGIRLCSFGLWQWSCRWIPPFWRNMLQPSLGLKCIGWETGFNIQAGCKEDGHSDHRKRTRKWSLSGPTGMAGRKTALFRDCTCVLISRPGCWSCWEYDHLGVTNYCTNLKETMY